ncbi:hypothetical protein D3C73_1311150 [compost metagenome]
MQILQAVGEAVASGSVFTQHITALILSGNNQIADALLSVHNIDEPAVGSRPQGIRLRAGIFPGGEGRVGRQLVNGQAGEILQGLW